MKIITKFKISSGLVVFIAIQSIAETTSATTSAAIQIDNTIPEPGFFFVAVSLLMFLSIIRK